MLLLGIIFFTNVLIESETSISSIPKKRLFYRYKNITNYLESRLNFKNFTTDSTIVIDMGMTYHLNSTVMEVWNTGSKNTNVMLDLLGNSPHFAPNKSCLANVTTNFSIFCPGYSRFIRIRSLQLLTIKRLEIKGHVTNEELFVGCYDYQRKDGDDSSDLDLCLSRCSENNQSFGGIMNGFCYCFGDLLELNKVEERFCSEPCMTLGQFCGNMPHIPIYLTDYSKLEKETSVGLSCMEHPTKCQKCPRGLSGVSCNIRNCSSNNGRCQEDRCESVNLSLFQTGICHCRKGFLPVLLNACNDTDECLNDPCWNGTTCVNSKGSFQCQCQIGFVQKERKCDDVDECAIKTARCDQKTTRCSNTMGSYECKCLDGFKILDQLSCSDINECTTNNLCHNASTECKNTFGSYECNCLIGYKEMNKYSCQDVDECSQANNTCDDKTSTCRNIPGSYDCPCLVGFKSIASLTCIDIEECLTMQHRCSNTTAKCRNIIGSYECWCNAGLTKINQFTCTDIDECTDRNINLCDPATTSCINIWGSYNCICSTGYELFTQYKCRDINECNRGLHSCGTSAICTNSLGSFQCFCGPGLLPDVYNYITLCEDIDECKGFNLCNKQTSMCINYHGGYSCQCKKGYLKKSGSIACVSASAPNANETTNYIDDDYSTEVMVSYVDDIITRIIIYLGVVACGLLGLVLIYLISYIIGKYPMKDSSGSSVGSF